MAKYAIVTGATSGFGEATARIFAKNGWNLVLLGRRAERLEKLKNELKSHVAVYTLCCDVREESAVNEAFASLPETIQDNIHILVNNAGLSPPRLTSLMMGGWFLATSIGNKMSGVLSSMWDGYYDKSNFFYVNTALLCSASLLMFLMLRWLNKIFAEYK